MARTPLGQFSRSRKDWNIASLRYGTSQNTGTGNTLTAVYSLNNNANDGSYLALWAVRGLNTAPRGLMVIWLEYGLQGADNGVDIQLDPSQPAIPGAVNQTVTTNLNQPVQGIVFKSDGATWLEHGDVPLFILPPLWRASCLQWEPEGNFSYGAITQVTFLWGIYSAAKSNAQQ